MLYIGGRLTLALYKKMNLYQDQQHIDRNHIFNGHVNDEEWKYINKYKSLIVYNINDYINLVIKITHQPKLRLYHTELILKNRYLLFQNHTFQILTQWSNFILNNDNK